LPQLPGFAIAIFWLGFIAKDLDRFVLSLLSKEPTGRPRDARVLPGGSEVAVNCLDNSVPYCAVP
jgi:hypothetical protein